MEEMEGGGGGWRRGMVRSLIATLCVLGMYLFQLGIYGGLVGGGNGVERWGGAKVRWEWVVVGITWRMLGGGGNGVRVGCDGVIRWVLRVLVSSGDGFPRRW